MTTCPREIPDSCPPRDGTGCQQNETGVHCRRVEPLPRMKFPYPAYLLAALLSAGPSAFSQGPPAAKPEAVGLSPERLQRIGMAVQQAVDDKRIAGMVTM